MTNERLERIGDRLGTACLYAVVATPLVTWTSLYYPSTTARAAYFRAAAASAGLLVGAVLLARKAAPRAWRDPPAWALALLSSIALMSVLAGAASWKGLFGGVERMWGALAWVHLLAFYVALRELLGNGRWGRFFTASLVVSSFVALYGFLAAAGLLPTWARLWPVTGGAMGSTVGNPGFASAYLLLHVAVAAVATTQAESRIRTVLAAGAGLLALVGLVAAGSRAVVAGLGIGALVAGGAVALGARSRRVRVVAGSSLAGLVLLGTGVWLFRDATLVREIPVVSRLAETELGEGNLQFRLMAWEAALDGFVRNPLLGAGPENFDLVWDRHVSPTLFGVDPETWRTDRTHNAFLQPLATLGVVGAVGYLILWVAAAAAVVRAWRSRRLPTGAASVLGAVLVAYAVYQFFWFENVHTTFAFVALVAYLRHRVDGDDETPGATSDDRRAPEESDDEQRSGSPAGRNRRLLATGAVGILLLAGSAWYHGRLLSAAHHVHRAVTSGSLGATLTNGDRALSVRPPGTPKIVTRYALRLVELRPRVVDASEQGRSWARDSLLAATRRTARELSREIDRNPRSARLRYLQSALHVTAFNLSKERGEYEAAVRSMEAAVENAPTTTAYYRGLAQLHRMASRWEAAERVLAEALRVYPTAATRVEMARTLLAAGEPERGVTHLLEALRSGQRLEGLAKRYREALREAGAGGAVDELDEQLGRTGGG